MIDALNAVRQIPFHAADVGEAEAAAAAEVIRSGWLTMGRRTIEFEEKFASYIGTKHAVSLSSCTAGLHLALEAAGIGPGDEVLVPANTFTATAEVVIYLGARPVVTDVVAETLCMDPEDAERRITKKTRAIIPVHFAGHPCAMSQITELARRNGLCVIEDAAHALPASCHGRRIGTISEVTVFSFYATKTLTTGEGGMAVTDNDAFAARMRLMRLHGIGRDAWKRYSSEGSWFYEVLESGFKYNLTDLQAAIGLVQLAKCDRMLEARERIAERYRIGFANEPLLQLPAVEPACTSAWHLYVIRLNHAESPARRSEVIAKLRQRGISTSVHFIPLHLHPFYRDTYGYRPEDFPVSTREYERYLSLPIYPTMSTPDVDYVVEMTLDVLHGA